MSQQSSIDPSLEEQELPRLPGLDASNNPIMKDKDRNDQILLVKEPVRDVDWRDGPREPKTNGQRRAAYGQQCGMVVPADEQCNRCVQRRGVFVKCVVNVIDGDPQAGGACMNCLWTKEAYRCSFRLGKRELPAFVRKYIASTAQTAAVQTDDNTLNTYSLSTQVAQEANLNESVSDELSLIPAAREEPARDGPLYISPFQRPPSELSLEELEEAIEVLRSIQAHVNVDMQLLLYEIQRRFQ